MKCLPELSAEFSIDETLLHEYLDEALRAGKHNEFHTISIRTNLHESYIKSSFCRSAAKCNKEEFEKIEDSILKFLQ
jgi:hypothetical protein